MYTGFFLSTAFYMAFEGQSARRWGAVNLNAVQANVQSPKSTESQRNPQFWNERLRQRANPQVNPCSNIDQSNADWGLLAVSCKFTTSPTSGRDDGKSESVPGEEHWDPNTTSRLCHRPIESQPHNLVSSRVAAWTGFEILH